MQGMYKMAIEKIQPEDFPRSERGLDLLHGVSEEGAAVKALQPGEAVRYPCRWVHHGSLCKGANVAYAMARRHGFRVSVRCRDKMVYVLRPIA
jgi:hypothetical protein